MDILTFLADSNKIVQKTYTIRAHLDSIDCFLCIHSLSHCCHCIVTSLLSLHFGRLYLRVRGQCTAKSGKADGIQL